jgi:hypothetical protein
MIENIILPSFEIRFYKSYTWGVDFIGLNRPVTIAIYHTYVPAWRRHSQINNI